MSFKNNFLIFKALLSRDLSLIFSNLRSIIIDSIVLSLCFILLFGYFLPTFGMSKDLSFPLFLGSSIIPIMSIAYTRAVNIKTDIEFKKFIDYQLTLPISKNWLLLEYIFSLMIELLLSSLFSIIIGIIILNSETINVFNFISFCCVYFASLVFFSIFFLYITFQTKWIWFISNTWERILTPMIHLGCVYFIWLNLLKVSSFFAKIILLNPLTYISEGFRASFFDNQLISIEISFIMLIIFSFTFFMLLKNRFNKFMDPV